MWWGGVLRETSLGGLENSYLQFEQKVTLEARFEVLAADVLKTRSSWLYLYVEW